ncbi:aminotransferase class V-fold PLP-dependent enzyme [Paracoccus aestuariivivens]|nr:aminotransferase class V-fold PLP-dependent enzyme [Paracoccus aestuariivivens]
MSCPQGWQEHFLSAGDALFDQDRLADRLFLIADGCLETTFDGGTLDQLGRGDVLIGPSAFEGLGDHPATVSAVTASKLYSLEVPDLVKLKGDSPEVYDRFLAAALRDACYRLDHAKQSVGFHGMGADLRRRVAAPRSFSPPRMFPFPRGTGAVFAEEADATPMPRFAPKGHILFREGALVRSIHLLVSGDVAIHRQSPQTVTTLAAGSLLDAAPCVAGEKRTTTAVALADTWFFEFRLAASYASTCDHAVKEAVLAPLHGWLRQSHFSPDGVRGGQAGSPDSIAANPDEICRAGHPVNGSTANTADDEFADHCKLIRESLIGKDVAIETPFGRKKMVYADYTASGRSLTFIEDFLRERVLPLYANTHTEASASGAQTTRLREEARAAVASSVNATEVDEVIFVGSGSTAAINRLVDILGLRTAKAGEVRSDRAVVFIGPYEHHSNILPWRHSEADVVEIPLDDAGGLDLVALRHALQQYSDRPLRIGSFSAASNVTGILTPVDEVTTLLHAHGALSFWDYAAAAPYLSIDMNPAQEGARKDAVFISPHKFVGGPGTPGVLVVKRHLIQSRIPTNPGGGTVDYVTSSDAEYSESVTHREESGTPAIIESIRCGLAFRLKDQVGAYHIHQAERRYAQAAIDSWSKNPNIRILGPAKADRLSIVSFLIRHGRGYLHHNFVVAVLNDLFGLQARGGCSCAGPYGARLLGLDDSASAAFRELTLQGLNCYKPGWARVNFNYFICEEEFSYIVEAVHLVATHGHALLPEYHLDPASGLWTHRSGTASRLASLSDLVVANGSARWAPAAMVAGDAVLVRQLEMARKTLASAADAAPKQSALPNLSSLERDWRWFSLSNEQAFGPQGFDFVDGPQAERERIFDNTLTAESGMQDVAYGRTERQVSIRPEISTAGKASLRRAAPC